MHEVAAVAGVSVKTVSRVVNGEPGVRTETVQRVLGAITSLGFRRNDLARSLRRGGSSATLGLVIEDVANLFYSGITRAVEQVASDRGYLLISGSCGEDAERERQLVMTLLRRRVDALLIVPASGDQSYLAGELALGIPAVFLDRPPRGVDADTVLLDNAGGARRAVEHLIAQGHRRIAVITDSLSIHTAGERLAGYREALDAAGLGYDERLVRPGIADSESAELVVRELLALPKEIRPTAIFAGNNRAAIGVLRGLVESQAGLGLVGFDDFELADMLGVSVIRYEAVELGRRAAELAFARLDGDRHLSQHVVVPTELVARGSGEVSPCT